MKNIILALLLSVNIHIVSAQTHKNNNLAGTYVLVSVDNIDKNGTRTHLYGDSPQGLLIFDSAGNYSLQIMSGNRLKFASADKAKGTDDENRAAVKGCNTHFGTYSVDYSSGTITFNILHASFPNWEGTQQRRPFISDGVVFKYTVPAPTTGGAVTGEVVWKKIK